MAELIEEIEKMAEEEQTTSGLGDGIALIMEHREELSALLDLLKAAHQSGVLTLLKAFMDNRGSASADISEELARPKNIRFIRNLTSMYTLLSNIDPEVVRPFMLNLAKAVDKSPSMKDQGPMGLMAIRSQMRDPDVAVGFRVLFEVAKGFSRESGKKD